MSIVSQSNVNAKINLLRLALTDNKIYDIVTALRGPDSGNDFLKHIFTGRIRSLLINAHYIEDLVRRPSRELHLSDILNAILLTSEPDLHYLSHVIDALNALREYNVLDEREYELLYSLAQAYIKLSQVESLGAQITGMDQIKKTIEEYENLIIYDIPE